MKVTYNWLKSYTDFTFTPAALVNTLTMLGLEVESIADQAWDFDGVVVGEVIRKERHWNADHLWVCDVKIGRRNLTIVCGAPNVAVGQKVAVAQEGTRLASGRVIERTSIRGVVSNGMLCSEAELGLSDRGEGILVLNDDIKLGTKLIDVLGGRDIYMDIFITPNRPDCLGVMGIAREIAALADRPLKRPKIRLKEQGRRISGFIKISIKNPDKCPRYTARFIGNVNVQPSPWWLIQKLEAAGLRSINNVVDVTNYVMLETGQPLHAFDYDLLKRKQIVVKTAKPGEEFTTLDNRIHKLNAECLMICDGERPVAIGGIMGGFNSEVSENTKNILLESAYFNPVNIRRTSKYLGISTESSRRFERGVDPNGALYALDRAAQLIAELAGGKVASGFVDVYPKPIKPLKLTLRLQRAELLVGTKIPASQIRSILPRLGLQILSQKGGNFKIEVPTFRPDITREADLIEEVARVFGFDNVPADSAAVIDLLTPANRLEQFSRHVQDTLLANGLSQVVTYSLLNKKEAGLFAEGRRVVELVNPISADLSTLRPSLLPGLLKAVKWNLNRSNPDLKFFETGAVFEMSGKKVVENRKLAAVATGAAATPTWKVRPAAVDIYDVKGFVEHLLRRNNITRWNFIPFSCSYATTKTLSIEIENRKLGTVGEIRSEVLEQLDIEQPVFFFELDFDLLYQKTNWQRTFSAVPKFPPVTRDIAIVLKDTVTAENVAADIKRHGGAYLQNLNLFDVYIGKQIGSDHKSLAYRLTFYSTERTLTDEEVDTQMKLILDSLRNTFAARLRE